MKKNILLAIFINILALFPIYAQDYNPSVIPPSPHAHSFLKYGDYPVSNYTGVPDISIPLYNIRLKDIAIPINLHYDASGIKVEEEAGRTGLGWNLNVGGVISHTVKGRYNDFVQSVYFKSSENNLSDLTGISQIIRYIIFPYKSPKFFPLPATMSDYDFHKGLSDDNYECGGVEFAPDIFNYNFMGYSGKFIFNRQGEIVKEKEDNLMIIPIIDHKTDGPKKLKSWYIIAPNGTKYYFDQTEETIPANATVSLPPYYSSFYLTKIITATGTIINFRYKKTKDTYNTYSRVQDSRLFQDISINTIAYETVYLDEITFPGGSINMGYTFDRKDYKPFPKLNNLSIQTTGGSPINWEFIYDYFVSNTNETDYPTLSRIKYIISDVANYYDESWNTSRLRLDKLKKTTSTQKQEQVYEFGYNKTRLPTKLSASMDHWGYYNGVNNSSLVPKVVRNISHYIKKPEEKKPVIDGLWADRKPREKLNEAFILNEIKYPTGGKTAFSYETNKYDPSDMTNDPYKIDQMYDYEQYSVEEVQNDGWRNAEFHAVYFTIPFTGSNTNHSFSFKLNLEVDVSGFKYSPYNYRNLRVDIENRNTKDTVFTNIVRAEDLPTPQDMNQTNNKLQRVLNDQILPPGSYILKLSGKLREYTKFVTVTFSRIIYPHEIMGTYNNGQKYQLGGGLRIKQITNFDANGKRVSAKRYNYTLSESNSDNDTSGKLMFYPRYNKFDEGKPNIDNKPGFTGLHISSNGLRGTGYSVGYSEVSVADIDDKGSEKGKTIYKYVNIPDKNLYYTWDLKEIPLPAPGGGSFVDAAAISSTDDNPSGIEPYKYSENGTLLKETVLAIKDGQSKPLMETYYTYNYIGSEDKIIWGILKSPFINGNNCLFGDTPKEQLDELFSIQSSTPMGYMYPAIRPKQVLLTTKKELLYDNDIPIETTTEYQYNDKYYLKTKKKQSSDNKNITAEYKYPFDLPAQTTASELVLLHRIEDPVEIETSIGNRIKSKIVKEYADYNSFLELSKIKKWNKNNELETRLAYHKYDSYSNPIHLTQDSLTHIVYLWSYSGQYPVAEIKNATYTQVNTALASLGLTSIDALSKTSTPNIDKLRELRTKLTDAMVSVYSYQPLVGMLSSTDPQGITTYYSYDAFGRLKETYLMENGVKKVLQVYDYHYTN